MKPDFTIIIPAYNEAESLPKVLSKIEACFSDRAQVIVVDDGSVDSTEEIVKNFPFEYIRHDINRGKGEAIKSGLKQVNSELVVFIDADGQDDPQELNLLVKEMKNGADVVVGSRFLKSNNRRYDSKAVKPVNYFGNILLTTMLNFLFKMKISDSQASLKSFKMNFIKSIKLKATRYEIETEMLIKAAKRKLDIREVPVHRYPRGFGHSELFDVPFGRFKFALRALKIIWLELVSGD